MDQFYLDKWNVYLLIVRNILILLEGSGRDGDEKDENEQKPGSKTTWQSPASSEESTNHIGYAALT